MILLTMNDMVIAGGNDCFSANCGNKPQWTKKKPATPCKKFAKKAACLLPTVGAFINMYLPCDKG